MSEIYRCLQERDVDKLISVQKAHVQAFKENLALRQELPFAERRRKYKPHKIYLKYITNSDFKLKGDQL